MELTFFHESLLTVTHEHVLKMNVILTKECIHIFSQTENAFSVDREWPCESNTIRQNIHLVRNACMKCLLRVASFPGLPTVHFLTACRTDRLQDCSTASDHNWMVGRSGNKAIL